MCALIAVGTAFLFACSALALRPRLLRIWNEIWSLRSRLDSVQRELVAVRKELILETERGLMRLPPGMPSQNGEDLVLWRFFEGKRDGFFVEIGAFDGVSFSNTYFFEAVGWSGILVEAVPEMIAAARQHRPFSRCVHAVVGSAVGRSRFHVVNGPGGVATLSFSEADELHRDRVRKEGGSIREIQVPLQTLDAILGEVDAPIDFISIDVEGGELEVLKGFSLDKYQPRVLVVEDNSAGRDTRVREWLGARGYVERLRIEQNAFYCRATESRPLT